jgi:hypothetical protein
MALGAHGLRDVIAAISPPWLAGGDGIADASKRVALTLLYVMGLTADLVVEKVNEAVFAWMPTKTKTTTSLTYLGDDRRIPQGPNETSTAYGIRLQRAFSSWRFAGIPRGKLSQLLGFVSPALPRMQQVSNGLDPATPAVTANWYVYAAGADARGPTTFLSRNPNNWDWDSLSDPAHVGRWWRLWVILDATGWTSSAPALGAKALGDTRYTLGFGSPQGVFTRIKDIVALWKRGGAYVLWIVVQVDFSASWFVATDAPGAASLPDGKWGPWSKIVGTTRVASRTGLARYIATSPEVV